MDSDDDICTPPDILELPTKLTHNLLPEKSRKLYEKEYNNFLAWKIEKKTTSFSENVILAYLKDLSDKFKPSSMWAKYSMLKSTLSIYNDIDITKYSKVIAFLKRSSEGHKEKKSLTFTSGQIKMFLEDSPDILYLFEKVALIFGIMGACRRQELYNIQFDEVSNIDDSTIMVKVSKTKTKIDRSFVVTGNCYAVCKKYMELRPTPCQNPAFFLSYRSGKCVDQRTGINKFGALGKSIASFLNLPNPALYTGHCFRRTSATLLIDSGGDLTASVNKNNVEFFDNYAKVLRKYGFTPDRIYNLDETNIMTPVQGADVTARIGANQVGQCASADQGQLITMCGIGNALGNFIPPVFIFPRARFHDSIIRRGPPGCVGYASSSTSGLITGPLFIKVLEHMKNTVKSSNKDPILLLMDNHESHCTLEANNYCRENGIVVVTFPPHCAHRFQPLELAVNGPFKQKLAEAQNDWLVNHPGKTITIHDLVDIVTLAYNATYIAKNMVAGFAMPGIHPFSRNTFSDDEFKCTELTNRPSQQASSFSAEAISVFTQHSPEITAVAEDDDKTDCKDFNTEQEINVNDDLTSITASAYFSTTTANLPLEMSSLPVISASTLRTPLSKTSTVLSENAVVALTATSSIPLVSLPGHSNVFTVTTSEGPIIPVNYPSTSPQTSEIPASLSSQIISTNNIKTPNKRVVEQNITAHEQVRPIPKAQLRIKSKKVGKAKTRILTDTPRMDEIQKVYIERQARLGKSRGKISGQKKRKYFNLQYSSSKGSELKTATRKKTKTILTYSSDESDTEMDLGSENEVTVVCEENIDTNDCVDEDYEKDIGCGVLNSKDFVAAQVLSENSRGSLVDLLELTEPRPATSRGNIENGTNEEDDTNVLTEESMSTDNETFSTKNENSCYTTDTVERNNGENEIAFEDVKLAAPSYSSFMDITARDVINVAPETLVWTKKLNSLHPTTRLYVEKAINDIIFEAELGNISKDSVKINGK